MAVDILQEKIRKTKNPTMVELCLGGKDLPVWLVEEKGGVSAAYEAFCKELLTELKGLVPAIRVSFSSFALLGGEGLNALTAVLKFAKDQGFYVALDAPEISSSRNAAMTADAIFGTDAFPCDGLIIPSYMGSDIIKPFLPYCKDQKKDIFVAVRTANKSASELQDLLSGSRVVHAAAADHVNRYGADTVGKHGYTRVGILASASAGESVRSLRSKYPKLFMLIDGYDYPNGNGKNCGFAFDRYGHGAVVIAGTSVTCAWSQGEGDGRDFAQQAVEACQRMKKNLARYTTVL